MNERDKKFINDTIELKAEIAELQAYKDVNEDFKTAWEELKAENEQLKKSIDRIMQDKEIKTIDLDIAFENQKLKQENERLKELKCKFKEYCTCNTEKYVQCLQEIKEMAKRGFAICDDDCGNAIRYTQILDLITKAEEE